MSVQKPRHAPIRSCIVCRQTSDKRQLLRVVRRPEKDGGGVSVDPTGKASGRGSYVCAVPDCAEKAIKQKRFERALGVAGVSEALHDPLLALVGPPRPMTENRDDAL